MITMQDILNNEYQAALEKRWDSGVGSGRDRLELLPNLLSRITLVWALRGSDSGSHRLKVNNNA